MPSSDPVGDMLAMINNAIGRRHKRVEVPHSRMKEGVASVLKSEGYVEDVRVETDEKRKFYKRMYLYLKYDLDGVSVITRLRRVSRPGRRVFRGVARFGKVLDGMGVSVLSTSKGILSDRQARQKKVGGEMICEVW